jgi:hypothetical protein
MGALYCFAKEHATSLHTMSVELLHLVSHPLFLRLTLDS